MACVTFILFQGSNKWKNKSLYKAWPDNSSFDILIAADPDRDYCFYCNLRPHKSWAIFDKYVGSSSTSCKSLGKGSNAAVYCSQTLSLAVYTCNSGHNMIKKHSLIMRCDCSLADLFLLLVSFDREMCPGAGVNAAVSLCSGSANILPL